MWFRSKDVLTVKDHVLQCEERLQKAPRQADLTAAVRRTFEEMSQEFHTECPLAAEDALLTGAW